MSTVGNIDRGADIVVNAAISEKEVPIRNEWSDEMNLQRPTREHPADEAIGNQTVIFSKLALDQGTGDNGSELIGYKEPISDALQRSTIQELSRLPRNNDTKTLWNNVPRGSVVTRIVKCYERSILEVSLPGGVYPLTPGAL